MTPPIHRIAFRHSRFLLAATLAGLVGVTLTPLPTGAARSAPQLGATSSPRGTATVSSPRGTATVSTSGAWSITTAHLHWVFGGNVGTAVSDLHTTGGRDAIGAYRQISFTYQADGARRTSSITIYNSAPSILFRTTYLTASSNTAPFPVITTRPNLSYNQSFSGCIFEPRFNNTSTVYGSSGSPILFFNAQDQAYLISPASNFEVAQTNVGSTGDIASGVLPAITTLPAGFSQATVLTFGTGINSTYTSWGHALTSLSGKKLPSTDENTYLNKIGYWTDHGAAYYYRSDSATGGITGTLLAVKQSWAKEGLPLGYMQLDGWFYPKGASANWLYNKGGIYLYEAAPALFPNGLAAFQHELGLPLAVQAKFIGASSPYRNEYPISGTAANNGVVISPQYWSNLMSYLKTSGVINYEQDFMCAGSRPATTLTAPSAFFNDMTGAAARAGVGIQYSMPLARNILESTLFNQIMTSRVSNDRFDQFKWTPFLFDSRLASAVGLLPFSDVHESTETKNMLLSVLSAGPEGVGDPIGAQSPTNIRRAVMPNGTIVKPDVPIVPTDSTYIAVAEGRSAPIVASTYTSFGHGQHATRADYVFAYSTSSTATQTASFIPAHHGIRGWSYVYDYFTGAGQIVPPGGSYSTQVTVNGSYFVVVPVGPTGLAFLGDTGQFVPLGKKRITHVTTDGAAVRASVAFTPGENAVGLSGFAPSKPSVSASVGRVGNLRYDPTTGLFHFMVTAGSRDVAVVTITTRNPPVRSAYGSVLVSTSSGPWLEAGQPADVTATFMNKEASGSLLGVRLNLQTPPGWFVTPISTTNFPSVSAGGSVQATWQVIPAPGARPIQAEALVARATDTGEETPAIASSGGWQVHVASPPPAPFETFASTTPAVFGSANGAFGIRAAGTGTTDSYGAIYIPRALTATSTVTVKVDRLDYFAFGPKEAPPSPLGQPHAGILVSDSIASNTATAGYVALAATPTGVVFRWDATSTGALEQTVIPNAPSAPVWLRLERAGPTFTAYYSVNGTTWTEVGTASVASATSPEDVGMYDSGIDPLVLGGAKFSHFTLSGLATTDSTGAR